MGRKAKPRPKGKQQGKALSPIQKEQIRQTFMLTSNKRETARMCGVSEKSVYNVVNEPEEPEVIRNREHAANQLSGKVHVKANQVLDSITEEDFESGYLKDEDGNLVFDRQGRPIWMGPTLNQKTVSAAILADKLPVLQQYRSQLGGSEGMGELPAPESIKALVAGIQGKLKSLSIIDVQFESGNREIKDRADDLLKKAQAELDQAPIEADYVTLDDFDNPKGDGNEEAASNGDSGVPHQDQQSA
ncbi:MAG: hypothetical protein ACYTKD_31655 [Planctomycetota bacterium]|jgi:hypothetical protein